MIIEEIGALDMGSKSVKFVGGHQADGRIVTRLIDKMALNLGKAITANQGVVPRKKLLEIGSTISVCQEYCRRHGMTQLLAIATHAINQAQNKSEVVALCQNHGVELEVVDGPREAEIGYLAATGGEPNCLVSELGSHSCQIAWQSGEKIQSYCIPQGYVGAYMEFIRQAPNFAQARTDYRLFLGQVISKLPHDTHRMIALAANSVTSFVLEQDKNQGNFLPQVALRKKIEALEALTEKRFEALKRNTFKVDKLLVGLIFMEYLLQHSEHHQAEITSVELPTGLIVEYFQNRVANQVPPLYEGGGEEGVN